MDLWSWKKTLKVLNLVKMVETILCSMTKTNFIILKAQLEGHIYLTRIAKLLKLKLFHIR